MDEHLEMEYEDRNSSEFEYVDEGLGEEFEAELDRWEANRG